MITGEETDQPGAGGNGPVRRVHGHLHTGQWSVQHVTGYVTAHMHFAHHGGATRNVRLISKLRHAQPGLSTCGQTKPSTRRDILGMA